MDLIETEYGREGSVLFKLTGTEIDLLISDEEVTDLYIEKCIESLNNLSDALIAEICTAAKKYCLTMKKLCEDSEGDFEDVFSIPVTVDTPDKEMLQYFQITDIVIEEPENENIVGFQLSGNCDWDTEHGIEIIILDDNLLYLGAFEDNSPWYDYDKNDKWNFVN